MPELPEVETIRRQLSPLVEGRRIDRAEVLDPRWCRPAGCEEVAAALGGRAVERLERRGKYLVWALEHHAFLVMHLRMTGNVLLVHEDGDAGDRPHLRVRLGLDSGARVLYCDARRFGNGVVLLGEPALASHLAPRVGVEPLSPGFSAEALREMAAGRRAPVKAFLLSQERIAGVGNIYADEALFRAGIHPLRAAGSLTRRELSSLRDAVVESLEAGIDARGATIDDFRHPDGERGSFQTASWCIAVRGSPAQRAGAGS